MKCQVCNKTFDDILMCASCKYLICDSSTLLKKWKCPECGKQISAKCSMIQDNKNMASSTVDEEARAPQSAEDILKPTLFGIWLCIFAYIFLIYLLIPCFSFILTNLYTALSFFFYYVIIVPGSYSVLPVFNAIYPYTLKPLIYYGSVVVSYVVVTPFEFVGSLTIKYLWEPLLLQIYQYIQEFITLIFLLIYFVTSSCFSLLKWILSTPYCLYCERSPVIFLDWDPVGFGVANSFLFALHSLRTIFFVLLVPTVLLSLRSLFVVLWGLNTIKLNKESLKSFKDGLSKISDFLLELYEDIFKALAKLFNRGPPYFLLSTGTNMYDNYYYRKVY